MPGSIVGSSTGAAYPFISIPSIKGCSSILISVQWIQDMLLGMMKKRRYESKTKRFPDKEYKELIENSQQTFSNKLVVY